MRRLFLVAIGIMYFIGTSSSSRVQEGEDCHGLVIKSCSDKCGGLEFIEKCLVAKVSEGQTMKCICKERVKKN
jgi:hypothetical protein